jgi:hypothetical protein
MICSIWMTLTAAIKPNKRPNKESWYDARYLNAIKYPLIEQARLSRERISKKHPSFLNYLSRQIFKERRLGRQRKSPGEDRPSSPDHQQAC